jgi:DNA segregation ATPase FtsK/SpoIIIE-like protein
MARWQCNAPNPGSYLQGRGIVMPGQEFTTPDDPDDPFFERARQMWVPLDAGAEKLVKQAKADVEEMNKENARAAAERRRLEDEAASGFRKAEFKTREDQGPGISQSQRFVGKFVADEEDQKRNDAWTKQVRKQQGKDDTSEEKQAVQEIVREHIALAGGAAAQPVADPGDLTAPEKDAKGAKKK